MKTDSSDARLTQRATKVFEESLLEVAKVTDQNFLYLLPLEYIVGILFAVFISPFTWIGQERLVHLHVFAALFFGLLLISFPLYLIKTKPGQLETRYTVAVSQMLIGALYIHLTGGRIETHFHVFGSLAILAAYRDYRVLAIAALVVVLDHMIRGIFYPQSVFGVLDPMHWRWLEHGAWIVFEGVFLGRIIRQSRTLMKTMAYHQAELENTRETIENEVNERTLQLMENELKLQEANQALEQKNKCEVAFSEMLFEAQQKKCGEFLNFCLEKICELGDWPLAQIYGHEIDSAGMQVKYRCAFNPSAFQYFKTQSNFSETSCMNLLADQVMQDKRMMFRSVSAVENYGNVDLFETLGVKSIVHFPIFCNNSVTGVLEVLSCSRTMPDNTLLLLLERVSLLIGTVFEKQKMEADVLKSSQRFGVIFNQSCQFTWILNQIGQISEVNQLALEMFDIDMHSQTTKPFWESEWFKSINISSQKLQQYFKLSCNERPVRFEGEISLDNGSHLFIDFTITGIKNSSGKTEFFLLEGRDITDLKTIEGQLKETLLELGDISNALDEAASISVTDISGKIIYANYNFYKFCKYTPEEILGKTHQILNSGYHSSEFFKNLWSTISNGKIWRGEIRNKDKNGDLYWVETTIIPAYDIAGRLHKYIAIRQNITRRKQAEANLLLALEKADSASKAKGEFLANMSHEIRTPLNAILGISNLLKETQLDGEQKNYLDIVHSAGDGLLCVVNDILDFSKIESGKLNLENIELNIQKLIEETSFLVSKSITDKGLTFECEIAEDIPQLLMGDPVRLRQILLNLINNAIKFTSTGKIKVTAQIDKYSLPFYTLKFSITDTGMGIAKEAQADIFNAFSQENTSTTRLFGGTGLGLSICKALSKMMNGDIWLESELGSGSTFFFTVRFEAVDESAVSSLTSYANEESGLFYIQNKKVLLVDDNKVNQLVAMRTLQKIGLQVELANNGKEAVDAVSTNQYDFILMDCQMPVLDGYQASQQIRSNELGEKHVPIIALTAHALEGEREKCLSAGMDCYLSKPFKKEELIQILCSFVGP